MVPRRQRLRLGLDAEQPREEVLQVRRERDQELGLVLCGRRPLAGRQQTFAQPGVSLSQEFQERGIDARETVACIQILEGKIEAQVQHRRLREL